MRIAFVSTAYPEYLRSWERGRTTNEEFKALERAFYDDGFGWADFLHTPLKAHGFESIHLCANNRLLQEAWARENGTPWRSDWIETVVIAQIQHHRAEIVFVEDFANFGGAWVVRMREACPSVRKVVGWCSAPCSDTGLLKEFDLVMSCVPELVQQFGSRGMKSVHMNHAVSPNIVAGFSEPESGMGVTFVGQILRTSSGHRAREHLLCSLVDAGVPLSIYSSAYGSCGPQNEVKWVANLGLFAVARFLSLVGVPRQRLREVPVLGYYASLDESPRPAVNRRLCPVLRPPVFGREMYSVLHRSSVTLNSHIGVSSRSASNMRLFEATGAGACLLTDAKENLRSLFEPDSEVVTWATPAECAEKVAWLLENPEKARDIAAAGNKRCLKDHTWGQRAPLLGDCLRRLANQN